MTTIAAHRHALRADTTANWESEDPVLGADEEGVEILTDGSRLRKLGDGSTAWTGLGYADRGPAPVLNFAAATNVAAGGTSTVTVTETSPGVYSVQLGLVVGMTGPAGLNWRNAWDAGTQYAVDDAVYYQGSSYYAVAVPAVGAAPDPAKQSPWMELAVMGQKGEPGDNGSLVATSLTDTGTVTIGAGATSTAWRESTITGNVTYTMGTPSPPSGETFNITMLIRQDATGGHTITWDPAIRWPSGVAPSLPTTAGAVHVVTLAWSPLLSAWCGFVSGTSMAVA